MWISTVPEKGTPLRSSPVKGTRTTPWKPSAATKVTESKAFMPKVSPLSTAVPRPLRQLR